MTILFLCRPVSWTTKRREVLQLAAANGTRSFADAAFYKEKATTVSTFATTTVIVIKTSTMIRAIDSTVEVVHTRRQCNRVLHFHSVTIEFSLS